MPTSRFAAQSGIFSPSDLELLEQVYSQALQGYESKGERGKLASRVIAGFMAGIVDEEELVTVARQPLGR